MFNELEREKREIEDVLTARVLEMKEDNERFLQQLKTELDQRTYREVDQRPRHQTRIESAVANGIKELPLTNEREKYEQSFEAKVLNLAQQGYTANEIAKKVKKGKGEIELLLKFQR